MPTRDTSPCQSRVSSPPRSSFERGPRANSAVDRDAPPLDAPGMAAPVAAVGAAAAAAATTVVAAAVAVAVAAAVVVVVVVGMVGDGRGYGSGNDYACGGGRDGRW